MGVGVDFERHVCGDEQKIREKKVGGWRTTSEDQAQSCVVHDTINRTHTHTV